LTDLLWLANTMDAVLRMIIGMIGASVLFVLLDLQLVRLGFGDAAIEPRHDDKMWLIVLLIGFIAGFSERLVPDLLAAAVARPANPPPPRRDADRQPAAGRKTGSIAEASASGSSGSDVDPSPEQADLDHCLCGLQSAEAEATRDEDLPVASGGVTVSSATKS